MSYFLIFFSKDVVNVRIAWLPLIRKYKPIWVCLKFYPFINFKIEYLKLYMDWQHMNINLTLISTPSIHKYKISKIKICPKI
jgi:hypothetical protein